MIKSTAKKTDQYIARKKAPKKSYPDIILIFLLIIPLLFLFWSKNAKKTIIQDANLPPLAMSGGDPYIRALMLTISASESNHNNSYFLLYGGSHVHDLTKHPNKCIPIKIGPNQGQCSTAAGRYQFLTYTWREKAAKYHPNPKKTQHGISYSFEPKYQDIVVYRWLKDHHHWELDLVTLLKEDRVEDVLTHLSDVWTSLGGGIEDNSMTPHLPQIYRHFLAKELESMSAYSGFQVGEVSSNGK